MPCGGTRPGEEVRDDPHSDNRSGSNRCGVAPTAAPLRSQDGSELSGTGLYTAHVVGRVVLPPLLGQRGLRFGPSPTGLRLYTVPGRALHGASWSVALRSAFLYVARDLGCCDHTTLGAPGTLRTGQPTTFPPRARRTGFSHRFGAPTTSPCGAPALYWPWPRYSFISHSRLARPSHYPVCVARDLGGCEHDYPRWGGHNPSIDSLQLLHVLGSSASLIGSEFPPTRLRPFALSSPDAAGVVLCTPGPLACQSCT